MTTKISLWLLPVLLIMSACAKTDDNVPAPGDHKVTVELDLNSTVPLQSRAIGDNTSTVNRLLILPFQKVNESDPDVETSFQPNYDLAAQVDVSSFPLTSARLELLSTYSYRVLVIGYNQNDFNYRAPTSSNKFTIGSSTSPANLSNFYLYPKSAAQVPEFFSVVCTATDNGTNIGSTFKPSPSVKLSGNLTRKVSAISVTITNVPPLVSSVTLVADHLTQNIKATDGTPLLWQTAYDPTNKLSTKTVPLNGTVVLEAYLLPVTETRKTPLYLDINVGGLIQRYTIKVNDVSGVSSGNQIYFPMNYVVNISGNYSLIDFGFTVTGYINLDDNAWDGIH